MRGPGFVKERTGQRSTGKTQKSVDGKKNLDPDRVRRQKRNVPYEGSMPRGGWRNTTRN